jgi:hypothetical protein
MHISWQSYTLPDASAYGAALQLNGDGICAIECPVTLTSTKLNVQASFDGSTWVPLHNPPGALYQITVAAGKTEKVDPKDFAGIPWIKLALASTEGAARTIKISLTDVYI